jgi:mersacidin/lichenicidin family type 2 lantibiotic
MKGKVSMNIDIIRAWKDDAYRQGLSEEQLGSLPANPAGEVELSEADLQSVYGIGDGGFGANNFNRLQVSFKCSIECSLDCDIRKIYVVEPAGAKPVAVKILGLKVLELGSDSSASPVPITTSSDE